MHPFWRFIVSVITALLALYGYIGAILFIIHIQNYTQCGAVYCGLLIPVDSTCNPNDYQNSNASVNTFCLSPPITYLNISTANITSSICSEMIDCNQICLEGNYTRGQKPPFEVDNCGPVWTGYAVACCGCAFSTKIAIDGCPIFYGDYMLKVSILTYVSFAIVSVFNLIPILLLCYPGCETKTCKEVYNSKAFKITVSRSAFTGWFVLLCNPKSVIDWEDDLEDTYKINIFYMIFEDILRTVASVYFNQVLGIWTLFNILNFSSAILSIAWALFGYLRRVYKVLGA